MFTEECINTFLENQEQLFPQAVAESYEAAEAFLEDCMAQVVDSSEVFALPDGKYLIVEG